PLGHPEAVSAIPGLEAAAPAGEVEAQADELGGRGHEVGVEARDRPGAVEAGAELARRAEGARERLVLPLRGEGIEEMDARSGQRAAQPLEVRDQEGGGGGLEEEVETAAVPKSFAKRPVEARPGDLVVAVAEALGAGGVVEVVERGLELGRRAASEGRG